MGKLFRDTIDPLIDPLCALMECHKAEIFANRFTREIGTERKPLLPFLKNKQTDVTKQKNDVKN